MESGEPRRRRRRGSRARESRRRSDTFFARHRFEILIIAGVLGLAAAVFVPFSTASREVQHAQNMRADLSGLASEQGLFFTENGRFADRPGLLGFSPSEGVTVRILYTTDDAWAAEATHRDLQETDRCIVRGGAPRAATAADPGGGGAPVGEVICTF